MQNKGKVRKLELNARKTQLETCPVIAICCKISILAELLPFLEEEKVFNNAKKPVRQKPMFTS